MPSTWFWLLSFRLESCISSCSTPPPASPSTRIGTLTWGTTWRWCWTGRKSDTLARMGNAVEEGWLRDLLTKRCFLPLLPRPDKLRATTSNQGGFQRQAPLFGLLALIFPCKGGGMIRKVMQCMVVLSQCVSSRWVAALYFTDGRLPSLPDCCCCANNCANFILCNICTKTPLTHFAQARPGADSVQALLWRARRHACSCQGDDLKGFYVLCSFNKTFPSGLPPRFQSHPSHLRRPSDPRHLAGAQPPNP